MIEFVLVLISIAIISLLLIVYHKLSLSIDILRKELTKNGNNLFRQIEALLGIYAELQLKFALPQTRGWAGSPDFLRVVMAYARKGTKQIIVECSSGVSTVVLAKCVQLNGGGHVYSLEHDISYANKTREILMRYELEDYVTICNAPLIPTCMKEWSGLWYSIDELPSDIRIDMLVIDGPPHSTSRYARYPAIPILFKRLNNGAIIVVDDADRDDDSSTVSRWLQENNSLQTVESPICEKGCAVIHKQ